jgi:hypothetical protein
MAVINPMEMYGGDSIKTAYLDACGMVVHFFGLPLRRRLLVHHVLNHFFSVTYNQGHSDLGHHLCEMHRQV